MSARAATRYARSKRADLASSSGAGLLGAGLATLLGLAGLAWTLGLVVVGSLLHGWGMVERRRLEREAGAPARWWWDALWWGCWLTLAALGALLVARRL